MRGGSIQLSREFAEFALDNPPRAVSVIQQLVPETQERVVAYAVEALASGSANGRTRDVTATLPTPAAIESLILELIAKGFGKAEFRESIARAVSQLAEREYPVSDDTLAILYNWLTISTDGEDEKPDAENEKTEARKDSFLWSYGGFSIVPQGNYTVLQAIISVLSRRKPAEYDKIIDILTAHLAANERANVWRHILLHMNVLGNGNRENAAALFLGIFKKYPVLLKSREAVHALGHAHWWLPEHAVAEWLLLLRTQSEQAFGELITLIAMTHPDWEGMWVLTNSAVQTFVLGDGNEDLIRGVAFTISNLWSNDRYRKRATDLLCQIIPVINEDLAHPVLDLFRTVDDLSPDETTRRFLLALLENPNIFKFENSRYFVTERLLGLLPFEAELVGRIGLAIVDAWGASLNDLRTGTATVAPELVNLALTLHRMGGDVRELGMTLFERLLEIEAYGAREALLEIDERSVNAMPTQPRLPRRRRGNRRRRGS